MACGPFSFSVDVGLYATYVTWLLGCELRVRSETHFVRTKNGYGPKRIFSVPRFRTISGPWLAIVAPWAKANRELNNLPGFQVLSRLKLLIGA